ncbi:MAG TPA: glutamate-1-semialdehyde 2,1-aminomutase [Stenomitos sp.]
MTQTTLNTTRSQALWAEAQNLMPGGVNSPVRAFRSVGGDPIFIDRAEGAYMWDVDGNRYVDYIGSWGPMILGHGHPAVKEALHAALERGTTYGAPSAGEVELAQLIREAIPSIEMVRLVNSGTEATMSALRLARAFTGREKIVKFVGCYHGHADMLLVQAGSGVATLGLPDSPGVTKGAVATTLTVPYNDPAALDAVFAANPDSIAGVIVEPVVGNAGTLPPAPGFLEHLRAVTSRYGALLIFDEVMTGFRVAYGGAQERFGIKPDLTCLGKVIGGGLPVGAYGGRRDIMEMVAPAGPMYQAGTLSGNPMATAAGIATLKLLRAPGTYEQLERSTQTLTAGLVEAAQEAGIPVTLNQVGAMFTLFFTEGPVKDWDTAKVSDTARFGTYFRAMLQAGVYLAPSQFEAAFMSLAHSDREIELTLKAARAAFATMR